MTARLKNTTAFEDSSIAIVGDHIKAIIEAIVRLDGELTEAKMENDSLRERIRDLESELEEAANIARERSELEP